eukprot:5184262-Prorocentrum_lima.AAC.1
MEDVAACVRIMLGEVRLRTEREKSTRASKDVCARLHPSHDPTASAVTTNPAQKGKEHAISS